MGELLIAGLMLAVGLVVGFAGARIGGRFLPAVLGLGVLTCVGAVAYAAATEADRCSSAVDCEAPGVAIYVWSGFAAVGFWLLAVAMGYAISDRFRVR